MNLSILSLLSAVLAAPVANTTLSNAYDASSSEPVVLYINNDGNVYSNVSGNVEMLGTYCCDAFLARRDDGASECTSGINGTGNFASDAVNGIQTKLKFLCHRPWRHNCDNDCDRGCHSCCENDCGCNDDCCHSSCCCDSGCCDSGCCCDDLKHCAARLWNAPCCATKALCPCNCPAAVNLAVSLAVNPAAVSPAAVNLAAVSLAAVSPAVSLATSPAMSPAATSPAAVILVMTAAASTPAALTAVVTTTAAPASFFLLATGAVVDAKSVASKIHINS
ncbi:hypothetical protein DASB73_035280 [Starmerella bacillaris]|uniref:Uncharacterized protein n=1 Tax=Starmerella bacillaris TaxID=1247836 RepID=A0AAV5RMB0_STABA|nr:hypothetical protein DASB73_035280 [Starmerella bacillaris]